MAKPRGWGPWTQIKLDALEMLGYPVNFQPSKRDQFSASTIRLSRSGTSELGECRVSARDRSSGVSVAFPPQY